jgi:hypothetical protein
MPYFVNEKTSGSSISSGRESVAGNISSSFIDSTNAYDCVYSWRTGRGVDLNKMLPEPGSEGNLAERLLARKKVIERELSALERSAQGDSANFLTKDFGHDFGVLHFNTLASTGSVTTVKDVGRWYEEEKVYQNPVPSTAARMMENGNINYNTADLFIPDNGEYFRAKGATLPNTNMSTVPARFPPYGNDQVGNSTRLINAMNPFANQASFLATASELLRGDVPKILYDLRKHREQILRLKVQFKSFKEVSKAMGDQSLNIQFGWAPIIRDVAAGISVLLNADRALFPSDETRRRRETPVTSMGGQTTQAVEWGITPHLRNRYSGFPTEANSPLWNSRSPSGFVQRVSLPTEVALHMTTDLRLTAKFRTGLIPNQANNGWLDRGLDLLGLRLTPEVIWELTPWSWLIDWFSSMGSIIANVSTLGATNAILNYAYSTYRCRFTASYNVRHPVIAPSSSDGVKAVTGKIGFVEKYDFKQRIAASPFGFSVSMPNLSVTQWGILASLGLARQR